MPPIDLDALEAKHEKLKGPFGFTGVQVTLEAIADYTNFCSYHFPALISRLRKAEHVVEAARKLQEYMGTEYRWINEALQAYEEQNAKD